MSTTSSNEPRDGAADHTASSPNQRAVNGTSGQPVRRDWLELLLPGAGEAARRARAELMLNALHEWVTPVAPVLPPIDLASARALLQAADIEEAARLVDVLLAATAGVVLPVDSFASWTRPAAAARQAWSRLATTVGRLSDRPAPPAPAEPAARVARRLHGWLDRHAARLAERWSVRLVWALDGANLALERWEQRYGRGTLGARPFGERIAALVDGVELCLDCGRVPRALELLRGHPTEVSVDARLVCLLAWSELVGGRLDEARAWLAEVPRAPAAELPGSSNDVRDEVRAAWRARSDLPRPLVALRQRAAFAAELLDARARTNLEPGESRRFEGGTGERREIGASLLAFLARRRSDGALTVVHIEGVGGVLAARTARALVDPNRVPFERVQRALQSGAPQFDVPEPRSDRDAPRSAVAVPLPADGPRGVLWLEFDHRLVPTDERLRDFAAAAALRCQHRFETSALVGIELGDLVAETSGHTFKSERLDAATRALGVSADETTRKGAPLYADQTRAAHSGTEVGDTESGECGGSRSLEASPRPRVSLVHSRLEQQASDVRAPLLATDPRRLLAERLSHALPDAWRLRPWWLVAFDGAALEVWGARTPGPMLLDGERAQSLLARFEDGEPRLEEDVPAARRLDPTGSCRVSVPLESGGRAVALLVVEATRRGELTLKALGRAALTFRARGSDVVWARLERRHTERFGEPLVGEAFGPEESLRLQGVAGSPEIGVVGPRGRGKAHLARCPYLLDGARGPFVEWRSSHLREGWRDELEALRGTVLVRRVDRADPRVQRDFAHWLAERADREHGPRLAWTAVLDELDPALVARATLVLTPLSARRDRLPQLAVALHRCAAERAGLAAAELDESALAALWRAPWRGGVAELDRLLSTLVQRVRRQRVGSTDVEAAARELGIELPRRLPSRRPTRHLLEQALATTCLPSGRANQRRAALYLGWDRDTVRQRLVEAGLLVEGGDDV